MGPFKKYILLFIVLQLVGLFMYPEGIDQAIQFIFEQWVTWMAVMILLTFGIGWVLPKLIPFTG